MDSAPPLRVDPETSARRVALRILELPQQVLLVARQPLRHLHVHSDQQVAVAALLRRALAPDPEGPARLRARGDLERHRPVQGGNVDVRAQGRLGKGDGEREGEVAALPSEQLVRRDVHDDVQIAGRPARGSGLAAAREPDPGSVSHAGGDLHLETASRPDAARASARRARVLHDATGTPAPRAGLRHLEEPLVDADRSQATALGTGDGRRPRLSARPPAGWTWRGPLDAHRNRGPTHGLVEGDPNLRLEVGAACGPPLPPAPAGEHAEQVPQVADVAEPEVLDPDPSPGSRAAPTGEAAGSEARGGHVPDLVVLLALVLVADDVVGRRDLLEPLLGGLVSGVGVGVVLLRELAVCLLDLRLRRVLRHAEDLVVVLVEPLTPDVAVHRRPPQRSCVTRTPAGRTTRPLST